MLCVILKHMLMKTYSCQGNSMKTFNFIVPTKYQQEMINLSDQHQIGISLCGRGAGNTYALYLCAAHYAASREFGKVMFLANGEKAMERQFENFTRIFCNSLYAFRIIDEDKLMVENIKTKCRISFRNIENEVPENFARDIYIIIDNVHEVEDTLINRYIEADFTKYTFVALPSTCGWSNGWDSCLIHPLIKEMDPSFKRTRTPQYRNSVNLVRGYTAFDNEYLMRDNPHFIKNLSNLPPKDKQDALGVW